MKSRARILVASFVVAALVGLAWLTLGTHEPVYQGQPLSAWLEQARQNDDIDPEAANAVRAMGTNALPVLLKLVSDKDSAFRRARVQMSRWQEVIKIDVRTAEVNREMGAFGFEALGAAAKPAVLALIRLLEDDNNDTRAYGAYCLCLIGPEAREAIPQLTSLTNNLSITAGYVAQAALLRIKQEPAQALFDGMKDYSLPVQWCRAAKLISFFSTNGAPAVPMLAAGLGQTNNAIRDTALKALTQIHMRPELCIPALMPLLQSTNGFTRADTIRAIHAFGITSNRLAVAEITRCLDDPEGGVREQAAKALRQLDPDGYRARQLAREKEINGLRQYDPAAAAKAEAGVK